MSREQDNFPQFLFVKFQLGCVELNFHTCQIPRCWMMERPSWWNAADQYLGKMPFRVDQCKMTGEMRADIGERSRNLLPPARGLKLKNAKNTSSLEEFPLSWKLWKYICLVINLFQSSPLKMVTNSWPEGGGRGQPDRKLLVFFTRVNFLQFNWVTDQPNGPTNWIDWLSRRLRCISTFAALWCTWGPNKFVFDVSISDSKVWRAESWLTRTATCLFSQMNCIVLARGCFKSRLWWRPGPQLCGSTNH